MISSSQTKITKFLRRVLRLRIVRGAMWGLALWALFMSFAVLLLSFVLPESIKSVGSVLFFLAPVFVLVGGIFAWFPLRTPLVIAIHVEEKNPWLQGYLFSAVEFLRHLPKTGESEHLAKGIIQGASKQIEKISPKFSLGFPRWFSLCLALLLPAAVLAFFLVPASEFSSRRLHAVREVPVVGDLFVSYQYPKYTGLPPQKIDGLSGKISALKGTQVRLRTRADRKVKQAKIVFDGSEKIIPLRVREERILEGEFPLLVGGSYRFVLEDLSGNTVVGVAQEMEVLEDFAPEVTILSPIEEIEVHEEDIFDIEVAVQDDFQLTSLKISFQVEGLSSPQSFEVAVFQDVRKSFHGVLHQALQELHLREGDRVRYVVEAFDNDVLSGPKRGASASHFFTVFSTKERHEELIEFQNRLIDAMTLQLGDRIEEPFPPVLPGETAPPPDLKLESFRALESLSDLAVVGERLMREADTLADALADDTLSKKDVAGTIREIAAHLHEQARLDREIVGKLKIALGSKGVNNILLRESQKSNEIGISFLEDDIIRLEELVNRQRTEELRAIGEELSAARDKLAQLLEEYEKTKDPALKAEIEREIERIEATLKRFQEKLSQLRQEIPDEFYNLEALEPDEMKDGLQQMKESLSSGDIEGAKEALKALSEAIDATAQGVDEEADRFASEEAQERDKALEAIAEKASLVEEKEKELRQKTKEVEDRARDRAEDAEKRAIEAAKLDALSTLEKLIVEIDAIEIEVLSEFSQKILIKTQEQIKILRAFLEATPGIFQAIEAAYTLKTILESLKASLLEDITKEELRNDIFLRLAALKENQKSLEKAQKLAAQLIKELEKAAPKFEKYLSEEEKEELERLARDQERLKDEIDSLSEDIEALEEKLPGAKAVADPPLQAAKDEMEQAKKSLEKKRPTEAGKGQEKVLEKLGQFRQAIKEAKQAMRKSRPIRKPFEQVKIPGAEEYKAPKSFREEVMQGAREKDKAPKKFRESIKKYYEELLR